MRKLWHFLDSGKWNDVFYIYNNDTEAKILKIWEIKKNFANFTKLLNYYPVIEGSFFQTFSAKRKKKGKKKSFLSIAVVSTLKSYNSEKKSILALICTFGSKYAKIQVSIQP